MAKPLMSDAEMKRRKNLQGKISQTTSTLGLGGVALGTAGLVASKKPGSIKRIRKIPGMKNATQAGLKDAGLYTSLASGGIGGVGGYNFAAYTNAESRKRNQVKKSDAPSPFEDGFYGVSYDSEISKVSPGLKFKTGYLTARKGQKIGDRKRPYAQFNSREIHNKGSRSMRAGQKTGEIANTMVSTARRIDVPTALAGAAGGAALTTPVYRKKEVKKSSGQSAFGVLHD